MYYSYFLLFEEIRGKSLRDIYTTLSYNEKLILLLKLTEILSELAEKGLSHNKINPKNIYVDMETMKITLINYRTVKNFRFWQIAKTPSLKDVNNHMFYTAPDCLDEEDLDDEDRVEKEISERVLRDVWTIGLIISEMISGVFPWHNLSKDCFTVRQYLSDKREFPIPEEITTNYPDIQEIIEMCTKIEPKERCSMREIVNFLRKLLK